jgi:hypothetical protein
VKDTVSTVNRIIEASGSKGKTLIGKTATKSRSDEQQRDGATKAKIPVAFLVSLPYAMAALSLRTLMGGRCFANSWVLGYCTW